MAIPPVSPVTNPDEERDTDQGPTQQWRKMLGLIQKIGELIPELQETVRLASERQRGDDERARAQQRKDDERLRAILNTATGGGIERLIRSLNLPDAEKTFLRKKRWRLGREV
jgi:hypothetical protein